jgi:DHA1 family tetracycline resistance protein-like MFS transporter
VRTLFFGWLCGMLGFAVLALAPTTAISLISIPLLSLWGLGSPAMQSLMTKRVDKSAQGQLQGAMMSMFGVAGMIAPLVFTQVFSVAISPKWGFHLPGAPYWLAALLMLGSIAIAFVVTRRATVSVAAPQTE